MHNTGFLVERPMEKTQYIASVWLSLYITAMKFSRHMLPLFFLLFILVSELNAQISSFTIMGNYVSSFDYHPKLRLTTSQNTRDLMGVTGLIEGKEENLLWGGGLRFRYKVADSYTVNIVDDADSLTGETTEFKDQLTFVELFGTGSVILYSNHYFAFCLGMDFGLMVVDRSFSIGDGMLNLDFPFEVMPFFRFSLFPRNDWSPIIRFGYFMARPKAETQVTEYYDDNAHVTTFREQINFSKPMIEAGISFRF